MDYQSITLMDEMDSAIQNEPACLFYLSTSTCNVCKVLKPKVLELIRERFPSIKVYYIDMEQAPVISGQYRIFTIPTLLLFFEGKEFLRKSRNIGIEELASEIERPYKLLFE